MPRTSVNPHEAKVKEIRDAFAEDFQKWDPIYREGDTNMKFIAGDPWDPLDRKDREEAGRPVVTFDELGQYLNQAVNEVRMNPRAPKFTPEGDGASQDTARFYANLLRKTEYTSNAQEAYTTCYENALQRGFGFVRMRLEYEHERSFYQRVVIEPMPIPSACYPDSNTVRADGMDWKRFTYVESYTKSEFQRQFKEAEFTDFSAEQIAAVGSRWMGENRVQVAEFWEVEETDVPLREWEVPATKRQPMRYVTTMGKERQPRGGRLVQERVTTERKVFQYLTNGVELLSKGGKVKHEHPGTMIPFAPCYGKIVWINNGGGPERKILAMTTLAREPFAAFCFLAACELEAIGTITKNPYWAYEGQMDAGLKNRVKQSLHQPVAILEAKATLPQLPNVLLPLPQRNPMSVDLSAYALAKEGARRAIQAAMGWTPLPTQAQRRNEKSGVALKQIEESGQKGAYHFIDHYNDLIRRVGVIFEDLVDKVYDVEREVVTLEADKAEKRVLINARQRPQELPKDVEVLQSTKGRHSTTVDVGPEFESEREEAGAFLDNFIASPLFGGLEPPTRNKLLAIGIRERLSGPMGQKMADIVDPQRKEGELPPAEELMASLQEAQQVIVPGLQREIEHLQKLLDAKVIEQEGKQVLQAQADKTKIEVAAMQTEAAREDTRVDADTALQIAQMRDEIERMKLELQGITVGAKMEHESAEGERSREAAAAEGREDRSAAERQAAVKSSATKKKD